MTTPFKWPVPDQPPDEAAFHTCQFNEKWVSAVISALDQLRDTELWETPPDDMLPQVDQLLDEIMTNIIISPQLFPYETYHLHSDSLVLVGNAIGWVDFAGQAMAGAWRQQTAAVSDKFQFSLVAEAGTPHLVFYGVKGVGSGIMFIQTDEHHTYSIDLYNSTTLLNQRISLPITVDETGLRTFTVTMSNKNASSSGYACNLNYMVLRP